MKTYETLLAIALLAGFQANAAPQPENSPVANVTVERKIHLLNPVTQGTKEKNKIERYGNISSQPWTVAVGWQPGESAFLDGRPHETHLNLIWFGAAPQP
jgi:hypothetical protein